MPWTPPPSPPSKRIPCAPLNMRLCQRAGATNSWWWSLGIRIPCCTQWLLPSGKRPSFCCHFRQQPHWHPGSPGQQVTRPSKAAPEPSWPNRLEPSLIESSLAHSIALDPPSIHASFLRRANPLLPCYRYTSTLRRFVSEKEVQLGRRRILRREAQGANKYVKYFEIDACAGAQRAPASLVGQRHDR
jgi:hypothetical protein